MDVWEAITQKRAVREYRDEPLAQEHIERILDAGRRSQSSKNRQRWHFIAVQDKDRLNKLADAGNFLDHVRRAAMVVVIVTPSPPEERDVIWINFDIGQCAAYMQLAALDVGVVSCLGAVYHHDVIRRLLQYPDDTRADALISFGYPLEKDAQPRPARKARRDFDDVVHYETW